MTPLRPLLTPKVSCPLTPSQAQFHNSPFLAWWSWGASKTGDPRVHPVNGKRKHDVGLPNNRGCMLYNKIQFQSWLRIWRLFIRLPMRSWFYRILALNQFRILWTSKARPPRYIIATSLLKYRTCSLLLEGRGVNYVPSGTSTLLSHCLDSHTRILCNVGFGCGLLFLTPFHTFLGCVRLSPLRWPYYSLIAFVRGGSFLVSSSYRVWYSTLNIQSPKRTIPGSKAKAKMAIFLGLY
jgi:hypothetical protein